MSKTITRLLSTIFLFELICSFSIINAQKNIRYAPKVVSGSFSLSVQNLVQTAPNVLEFDVYLLNTLPAGTNFELARIQLGFLINASIQGSGTLSLSLSNVGSGLKAYQQFSPSGSLVTTSLGAYPDQTLLQQSPLNPPGLGNGTLISAIAPGTKLVHYILTNSVNFVSNTVPDLVFITGNYPDPYQELYFTGVSYYSNNLETNLPVNSGDDAIVNGDPILNPGATTFNVTGTGSICSGSGGLPVGIDGSQTGVTYTLYKNTVAQSPTVAGTGSAISFGNQPNGTYTVQGTLNSVITDMNGNAVITETPSLTAGVSISADNNPVNAGTNVTFTATPTGEGTSPTYQWYNGTNPVGTNSSVYTYVPTDGDNITVVMTSNAPCITGNPAVTSNKVTMSVTKATAYNVTGTGTTCSGSGGLSVGLDGSQTGVTYTLYKNTVAQSPTVAGTGSAITFGNQPNGTYTVQGTRNGISTGMNGNAVITETPSLTAGVSISADNNPVDAKTNVTFTATPTSEGTSPIYQWYKGTDPVGTNSAVYTYVPTDGDNISVVMTSNASCITGNPATSNIITMSVTLRTSIDQNKLSMTVNSKDKNINMNLSQNAKQVIIYNTLGSIVEKGINIIGLKTFYMDKSPNGYYIVKVITDNEVITQKVLLK